MTDKELAKQILDTIENKAELSGATTTLILVQKMCEKILNKQKER